MDPHSTDPSLHDHKLIDFSFSLPLAKSKIKSTISYRNLKNINADNFSAAIAASSLPLSVNLCCPGELLSSYNEATSNVLEALAPVKTRTVPSAYSSPWFTPELRLMKAKARRLERLYKKTCLPVHATLYSEFISQYKKALNTARATYLSNIINRAKCKPRTLFSEINKLVNPLGSEDFWALEKF